MSSLLRDHANLPCIIPILEYVLPKQTQGNLKKKEHPTTTHTHKHTHTHTHRKSTSTQELNDQVTRRSPSSPCPTGSDDRSPSPRLSQITTMLMAADLRKKVSHCSFWRKNLSLLLRRKLISSGTLVDEVRITHPQTLDAFLC